MDGSEATIGGVKDCLLRMDGLSEAEGVGIYGSLAWAVNVWKVRGRNLDHGC